METIKQASDIFWTDKYYTILFISSIIYIIFTRKDKESSRVVIPFVIYSLLLLFLIIYNPLFYKAASLYHIAGYLEYVRMFFILPFFSTIGLFTYSLYKNYNEDTKKRLFLLFLLILCIAASGEAFIENGMQVKSDNKYKIDSHAVRIADAILKDSEGEAYVVIDTNGRSIYDAQFSRDNGIVISLSQYSSKIHLINRFISTDEYNSPDFTGLEMYMQELEKTNYEYIIMTKENAVTDILRDYGDLEIFMEEEGYVVFKRNPIDTGRYVPYIHNKTINIDGVSGKYTIVVLNDLHIVRTESAVDEENKETVLQRYSEMFLGPNGQSSSDNWLDGIAEEVNEVNPDVVFFAGDMVDFCSNENIEYLKKGMEKINAPIIYVRSDHDYGTWYNSEMTAEEAIDLQSSVTEISDVYEYELESGFSIVGIDRSYTQLSDETCEKIEDVISNNENTLILTHVPFDVPEDRSLYNLSMSYRDARSLVWGDDDMYIPTPKMKELIDIIYADESKVDGVIAGHIHFPCDTPINNHAKEYVCSPSYAGNMTILHIN